MAASSGTHFEDPDEGEEGLSSLPELEEPEAGAEAGDELSGTTYCGDLELDEADGASGIGGRDSDGCSVVRRKACSILVEVGVESFRRKIGWATTTELEVAEDPREGEAAEETTGEEGVTKSEMEERTDETRETGRGRAREHWLHKSPIRRRSMFNRSMLLVNSLQ